MDTLFAMFTRRSVRQYDPGKVEEEQIENMLKAAMSAPSARNSRPWHFVVIDEPEKLSKISFAHPHASMAANATLAILVCSEPELEKISGYWQQDCAAATQNILLAAHAQALGAVWCGIYPGVSDSELRELFELPEGIIPMSIVVIGRKPSEPKDPERYMAERVHRNKFMPRKVGT